MLSRVTEKAASVLRIVCRCLVALAVVFTFAACNRLPDLENTHWTSVRVWFLADQPDVPMHVWETQDPSILQSLRDAYIEQHRQELTTGGYMSTNRVEIELADGKLWNMYFYECDRVRVQEPTTRNPNVSIAIDEKFYDQLKHYVERDTGYAMRFWSYKDGCR